MTDRQLALLIRAWANRLERELDLVDTADDLAERRDDVQIYVGPRNILGQPALGEVDKDENYQTQIGPLVILEGLRDLLAELRQAETDLTAEQEAAPA